MKDKKYQFKFGIELLDNMLYIAADTIEEAESKLTENIYLIIKDINRRKVGTLKWDFKDRRKK